MSDEPEELSVNEVAGIDGPREILDMHLDLSRDEKIRATALMMAVSWHTKTIVSDGQMYQAMQAQGKNLRAAAPSQVIDAAIVFEGYLRGHYNEFVAQVVAGVQHAVDDFVNAPDKDGAE